MKKVLLLGSVVLLFSCEPQQTCKTCTTIVKYPGRDVEIIQSTACGETIKDMDGRFAIGINPMTGSIDFYIMTTCK